MMDDSIHPSVLEGRNMEAVAKYIKEREVKRIVVMVGLPLSVKHPNMHC